MGRPFWIAVSPSLPFCYAFCFLSLWSFTTGNISEGGTGWGESPSAQEMGRSLRLTACEEDGGHRLILELSLHPMTECCGHHVRGFLPGRAEMPSGVGTPTGPSSTLRTQIFCWEPPPPSPAQVRCVCGASRVSGL